MKREQIRDLVVSAIADSNKLTKIVDCLFNAIHNNRITDEPLTEQLINDIGFIWDDYPSYNWSMAIEGNSKYYHIVQEHKAGVFEYLKEDGKSNHWIVLNSIQDLLNLIGHNDTPKGYN